MDEDEEKICTKQNRPVFEVEKSSQPLLNISDGIDDSGSDKE